MVGLVQAYLRATSFVGFWPVDQFLVVYFVSVPFHIMSFPYFYHFQLLYVLAKFQILALLSGKTVPFHRRVITTSHRVGFDSMDYNFHMNNGTYCRIADYGRAALLLPVVLGAARRNGWKVANGGVTMVFRRELMVGSAYTATTRVRSFDDKWFVLEHKFISGGRVVAIGVCRMVIKERSGRTLPPVKALEILYPGTRHIASPDEASARLGALADALVAAPVAAGGPTLGQHHQ
ncbi:hypothetical protein H696_06281 [Fonticula alba]|uniref:Thioesterase domain-containing protein n=1 Tax=Fonticula alba TaxID=691883 RepID=A0A058Z028_FONAL|nr:hypothetical protein H696_06281 [Fonticula alba]KCV67298.1 hypothetical protein H696_06281 [Fonticula alba]|eukprot:XP_009498296.1 hypothetical protein H696_06281 [Fonticula alba]